MASPDIQEPEDLSGPVYIGRTLEWALEPSFEADLIVAAGGAEYALYKLPLISKSGRIRKMLPFCEEPSLAQIDLSDIPGGAEAFELAAKFCYNIAFEMTTRIVAPLRCAAHYLEMTEEYSERNLASHCEEFLSEVFIQRPATAAIVLHSCENLLPVAEELNIVSRCINAASTACREQLFATTSQLDRKSFNHVYTTLNGFHRNGQCIRTWADDLSILRVDFYRRVLAAMKSQGLKNESIGGAIMSYAYHSIKGLNNKLVRETSKARFREQNHAEATDHEQLVLVETLVSMLPNERNSTPCSFLFGLLHVAVSLGATLSCRLELEQKIALQLGEATLDDLLIPSSSYAGDTLFEVDTAYRIMKNFLEKKEDAVNDSKVVYDSDGACLQNPISIVKVVKLLDAYLGEIASDTNLKLEKFYALASLFPGHTRSVEDNLYKAIDTFLKAHPELPELDCRKLCKLINIQKLSEEVCSHAAQNERLSVQFVIQMLYLEQLRLKKALATAFDEGEQMGYNSMKMTSGARSYVTTGHVLINPT